MFNTIPTDIVLKSRLDPHTTILWSFIYFHNECSDFVARKINASYSEWCAPDLIASTTEYPLEDGIYEVKVYDQQAYLFLWFPHNERQQMPAGLVVFPEDSWAVEDAYKKYTTKQSYI